MYYLIRDDDENYNGVLNKVSNSVKKERDCKRIYNKQLLKNKIGPHDDI